MKRRSFLKALGLGFLAPACIDFSQALETREAPAIPVEPLPPDPSPNVTTIMVEPEFITIILADELQGATVAILETLWGTVNKRGLQYVFRKVDAGVIFKVAHSLESSEFLIRIRKAGFIPWESGELKITPGTQIIHAIIPHDLVYGEFYDMGKYAGRDLSNGRIYPPGVIEKAIKEAKF